MKNILKSIGIAASLLLFSCGSGGGGNGDGTGDKPSAAALVFPLNNSECLAGQSISATDSKVTLEWNVADNTDSYFVYVKNLETQTTLQYNAAENTSLEVVLKKGVPYSWYVTSKSSSTTETATSPVWKFYNAGDGVVNYSPFPAEVVAPLMSSTISETSVNLEWSGNDVDGDITEFKVYMDGTTNPTTLKGTVTSESLNSVAVTANSTYYWKVITKDSAGNTSTSPVFQFKTQ